MLLKIKLTNTRMKQKNNVKLMKINNITNTIVESINLKTRLKPYVKYLM